MARVRTARHPKPEELEPENQTQEESEQTPENFALNGMSKAEAVRQALAQGLDKPGDIVDFAKSHGIELTRMAASSYKAQQKARESKGEPQQSAHVPSHPAGIPAGFGTDVKELRALIEKVGGAEELQELIGQLSGLIGKYGASGLGELIQAIE